jgi:type IV pilus assembly protein PilE
MRYRQAQVKGFSLVEVMMVVAIIGITAAIAMPSYNQYLQNGRRVDANTALMAIQAAQEQYRVTHRSYAANIEDLNRIGVTSPEGHYTLSITDASTTGYTATATAVGAQANDKDCKTIDFVFDAGTKTYSPKTCWKR